MVRLSITNPTDEPVRYDDDPAAPNARRSRTEPGLVLLPNEHTYTSASEGCWKLEPGTRLVGAGVGSQTPVDPGETITVPYLVWDGGNPDNCFPVGTYEFSLFLDAGNAGTVTLRVKGNSRN